MNPSEKELIKQLKAGNESAFRDLVALFQDRVFHTALGLLQQAEDAEDASQDVFIKIYRAIHGFREDSELSTWIYRITVTRCLDMLRSRKRKARWNRLLGFEGSRNGEPANFVHPGVLLDRKEQAVELFRHLAKLAPNQQAAFVLHKMEGLTYAEIAGILQVSEKAVDGLLQKARINLKKRLENN